LNAVVEKELEGSSDMQDCFWDLFNVVEELENKESSNYPPLPFTPVTINGKLVNALVDSGANPSYVSTQWVKKLNLQICEPNVRLSFHEQALQKGPWVLSCSTVETGVNYRVFVNIMP
jgi:hypothetical protein